jgi:hypothetical protein
MAFQESGGLMAFQEYDISTFAEAPESPLFAKFRRWLLDGFLSAGAELDMGSKLYSTFLQAGLPCPQTTSGQPVHCGAEAIGHEYSTQVFCSLLPDRTQRRCDVAEVDIDTLPGPLREDAISRDAVVFTPRLVGVWARAAKESRKRSRPKEGLEPFGL